MNDLGHLSISVKLAIKTASVDDEHAFGRGVADLCLGVRETGSLNAAAKRMNMAYSKAWRVVREAEAQLGFDLLDRDGPRGSTLTSDGEKLLTAYLEVLEELQREAETIFADRTAG
ncbi:MAG: LysR family transcriptional regulator [Eggerthellaceae bacterium]|nr:LysR family transcriptional regulator [Eggerthellaceae bacterium]